MNKLLTLIGLLLCSAPAFGCMWDYDTLAQERSRFPDTLELITGKFPRHSKEFYDWRIKDREQRMKTEPANPALFDDLAAAYEKTGNHQRAIELMLEKEKAFPGLYETYANLGTFYLHAGEYDKGLEFIDKAIALNPDAHFGREVYQKRLAEYVQSKRGDKEKTRLPVSKIEERRGYGSEGFSEFIAQAAGLDDAETSRTKEFYDKCAIENQKATSGVLGMMRFGNFDSPVLLEALGDLLLAGLGDGNAKQLAARAYLKASYAAPDDQAKSAYRKLAQMSLHRQTIKKGVNTELELESLERSFEKELAEAQEWYAGVRADELAWIASGLNSEVEFTKKYFRKPEVDAVAYDQKVPLQAPEIIMLAFLGISLLLISYLAWRVSAKIRMRRKLSLAAK